MLTVRVIVVLFALAASTAAPASVAAASVASDETTITVGLGEGEIESEHSSSVLRVAPARVVPFIVVMIAGLVIITYVPELTLAPARWVMSLAREEQRVSTLPEDVERAREGGAEAADDSPGIMTIEEIMRASEEGTVDDAAPVDPAAP